MIDLHLHTTASDGRLDPEALVIRAGEAGLRVISITDHDTTAAIAAATPVAGDRAIRLVAGIEITAVERERDIHVLGYFINPDSPALTEFLRRQRADRLRRTGLMANRLRDLGIELDIDALLSVAARQEGRAVGRPLLADALVASGHAASRDDAFDRFLGSGRPAFVPREGAAVADVIRIIHAAGGVASLAHPGWLAMDDQIPRFAAAGLDALEARHTDHDQSLEARYRAVAARLGLAISGGSDFHGEDSFHPGALGRVTLAGDDFAGLESRLRVLDQDAPGRAAAPE